MDKWQFQKEAIDKIVKGFSDSAESRLLLIIPTGGGKTLTAIRAIDRLIKKGIIDENNKCLWVTHLRSLKDQTIRVRDNVDKHDFIKEFNFSDKLSDCLDIEMVKAAKEIVSTDNQRRYKFIILDECHHSSASSYSDFFDRQRFGILGLTATPKRLDRRELNFERIVYQITADHLQDLGVIIKPREIPILSDFNIQAKELSSNKFDFPERNRWVVNEIKQRRAKAIREGVNDYSKVVVYLNTVEHVKNLYDKFNEFSKEEIQKLYGFGVQFITGGNNSLGISNEEFLDKFRKSESGVIINVDILSEGFDDPSINTIAMAVPTGSLVRFIQRVGRAIRSPNLSKEEISGINPPLILEFTDNLPNIKNKMSCGWLFADISDDLEPELKPIDIKAVPRIFNGIYSTIVQYKVEKFISKYRKQLKKITLDKIVIESERDLNRTNLFLYWAAEDIEWKDSKWNGIFINKESKDQFVLMYNNLNDAIIDGISPSMFFYDMYPEFQDLEYLNTPEKQKNVYNAMKYAYQGIQRRGSHDSQQKNSENRLKYFTFRLVGEYDSWLTKTINLLGYSKILLRKIINR